MEKTINNSLEQAEALRQRILRKAFEEKLVKPEIKAQTAKGSDAPTTYRQYKYDRFACRNEETSL